MRKIAVGIAVVLFNWMAGAALAQSPEAIAFLGRAYHVEKSDELQDILRTQQPAFTDAVEAWREAIAIGRAEVGTEAAGRAAIVRLMEAAVQLSGADVENSPLDRFATEDLAALKAAVGFPADNELLRFLFARDPSLRDEFEFESYAIVRILAPELGVHVILERADRPYLGLTQNFSRRVMKEAEDPVPVIGGERARTRRLNLAAMGDIIVAAKAYSAAKRVPPAARAYPLLIAADAIKKAAAANPEDFRVPPYRAHAAALLALRESASDDTFLKGELRRGEFDIARSAFFARQFADALESYRDAPVEPDDARGQLWSSWGQAISRLATRGEVGPAFNRVSELLRPDAPHFTQMFKLILRSLAHPERAKIGNVELWNQRIEAVAGKESSVNDKDLVSFNQDFLHVLETIGRPDIASRYLMDEIQRTERSAPQALREKQMLLWLAPFIGDYSRIISFQMSETSGWERRPVDGYNPYSDFLHSIGSSGELVKAGEVVLVLDEPGPYGAINPDEDAATTLAVYGIFSGDLFGLAETLPSSQVETIGGIENWVEGSLNRTAPSASAIPYIKLIWIEWFSQAFQALTVPGLKIEDFHYRPLAASKLTSRAAVEKLLGNPGIHAHERELLELFLVTRDFLERRYP